MQRGDLETWRMVQTRSGTRSGCLSKYCYEHTPLCLRWTYFTPCREFIGAILALLGMAGHAVGPSLAVRG
jgi:hypothetical protein